MMTEGFWSYYDQIYGIAMTSHNGSVLPVLLTGYMFIVADHRMYCRPWSGWCVPVRCECSGATSHAAVLLNNVILYYVITITYQAWYDNHKLMLTLDFWYVTK